MSIRDKIRYPYKMNQIVNYFKYNLSRFHKTSKLSYKPLWLLLYLSDFCNLHCDMCPHHSSANNDNFLYLKERSTGFMNVELVNKIMKKFPESHLVMLAGVGEPLLNPEFLQIVDICSRNNKKINLVTNGILLNDSIIRKLLSNKFVNQISISLNSTNHADYRDITGASQDEFKNVVENVKLLVKLKSELESNVEIVLSTVCSRESIEKSIDFIDFSVELGVDKIDIHRYIDFDLIGGKMKPINNEDESNFDVLKNYSSKYKTKVNVPKKQYNMNFSKKCEWFFKNLSFDAMGNVGSCGRVINPNELYGNIDDIEIWNNDYMISSRQKFLDKSMKLPKYCYNCVENYE